ncbi:PREDICTED: uncharacterized protein LOC109178451 [Ipomoea nil]|uniref:uncharacterized protein LOC109178451 n=1 Tax=Ipomoea nil TaxID=35883 RepID=UPI000901EF6A|nr:PREDICTED: uncharacterized protein LOC109178451 [Ipomoea nil]
MVKSSMVAKRWSTQLKDHPDWMMRKFKDKVCSQEGFYVSDSQAYRAIWKAKKLREGEEEDNFKNIWRYYEEICKTNPRSRCIIKTSDLLDGSGQERFLRIYVCWDSSKQGFKNCRKLIGVDGCHLRGATGGMLLTTVTVDANDSIFPLAYAVVEGEKRESWTWFPMLLKDDMEISPTVEDEYCFISDKQKGLIQAFGEVLPSVEHRFCMRHLHANMKVAGFQGKAIKDALWACARATTVNKFNDALRTLRRLDEDAYQWLGDNPIIDCLEWIRRMIMGKLFENKQKATEWKTLISPNIVNKLKVIEKDAAGYQATQCDFFKFEVQQLYGDRQQVDLERQQCSCRRWELSGIPCKHAICAI